MLEFYFDPVVNLWLSLHGVYFALSNDMRIACDMVHIPPLCALYWHPAMPMLEHVRS